MNKQECMDKMIMPCQTRRGKNHGGVIQILVTTACNAHCRGCTQNSQTKRKNEFITPEQFEVACDSLVDYFGIVGVFGGNPCIHPRFDELCAILRRYIPKSRCGLWCNDLLGHAEACRKTFNTGFSNLNVHLNKKAYAEMVKTWPQSKPFGLQESRHSPPLVAMQDVVEEDEMWDLVSKCNVNQFWSAIIMPVGGELKAYFCEIAGALDLLHINDPKWEQKGLPVTKDWWKLSLLSYVNQIENCRACGIPLKIKGSLATSGPELISQTHKDVFKCRTNRKVIVIDNLEEVDIQNRKITDYLGSAK